MRGLGEQALRLFLLTKLAYQSSSQLTKLSLCMITGIF